MHVLTARAAWETGRVQDDHGVVHQVEGEERACDGAPISGTSTTLPVDCLDCVEYSAVDMDMRSVVEVRHVLQRIAK